MMKLLVILSFLFSTSSFAKMSRITIDKKLDEEDFQDFIVPRYGSDKSAYIDLSFQSYSGNIEAYEGDDVSHSGALFGFGFNFNIDRLIGGMRIKYGTGSLDDKIFDSVETETASAGLELSYKFNEKFHISLGQDLYREFIINDAKITYAYDDGTPKTQTIDTKATLRGFGAYIGLEYVLHENISVNALYYEVKYKKALLLENDRDIDGNSAEASNVNLNYIDKSIFLGLKIRYGLSI